MEPPLDEILSRLSRSRFRARFHLPHKERDYLKQHGIATIREHGYRFISERLAPAHPHHDGKQTPTRGHPIFIAQHATATCCRHCLEKWHGIAPGQQLRAEEIDFVVALIERWLLAELEHDRSVR